MWQLALIIGGGIAAIAIPHYLMPASTAGSTTGTPSDSLLSKDSLEYASLAVGILASVGTIYVLTKGSKGK